MRTEFRFNGDAKLLLIPENDNDRKLLDISFNGNDVKQIKSGDNDAVILVFGKSEKKAE